MSLRESTKLQQASSNRSRSFQDTTDADHLPIKYLNARCKKKKNKSFQETPLATAGHDSLVVETRDGVPVVEIPSSPEEERLKGDRLVLLEPELQAEERQHLSGAASVFKSKLVACLKSCAEDLSYKDMTLLASECYNILEELGDDYASFHSDVNKLIAHHREVETATKDKEKLNELDIKARYDHQVQVLSELRQKLCSAREELFGAETKVDCLMNKEEQLTGVICMLTKELYEVEDRVKILTAERDQFEEACSDYEVGLEKLDAEMMESSVAVEAYNAAMKDFERISNHLLQLVKN